MARTLSAMVLFTASCTATACDYSAGVMAPAATGRPQEAGVGSTAVVFIAQNAVAGEAMTALFTGAIVLEPAGCLRLISGSRAVVWPKGFSAVERGSGVWIRDATGADLGPIGGTFLLAGGCCS